MRVNNKENQSCFFKIPFSLSGSCLLLEVEAHPQICGTEMQAKVSVCWQVGYVSDSVCSWASELDKSCIINVA